MRLGQTEHLVSFGIGLILILIGVVVISLSDVDVYDGLQRRINEQLARSAAERQLTSFLSTEVSFEGQILPLWRIFGDGRNWMKENRFSPGYFPPYEVLEYYTLSTFTPLYSSPAGSSLWYFLVQYDDGRSAWMGNAEALDTSCSKAYELYFLDTVRLTLPQDEDGWMTVELHYCIRP